MNVQLLVDAVVRQTTVLIAQLATAGGARAPLAHIANQVFLDLVREIEAQGVSRKVGADMFGLALRTYQRKIQRLTESNTERGRSLWEAVLAFLDEKKLATRHEVLLHFHRDDDQLVRGVLHDLTESGLVFSSGTGEGAAYRIATPEDLSRLRSRDGDDGSSLDAMLWALVYREGPLTPAEISAKLVKDAPSAEAALERLEQAGRVERNPRGAYHCRELFLPYGTASGWEAAVFDHFQSVVRTICSKLRLDQPPLLKDKIGGSTYTFVVWEGHPLADDVLGRLERFRASSDELRARVDAYNAQHGIPTTHQKVVSYGGQHVIEEEKTE